MHFIEHADDVGLLAVLFLENSSCMDAAMHV